MRPRERALIERLREVVDYVESLGKGVAVIENGDCLGFDDVKRVREETGTLAGELLQGPLDMLYRRTFGHDRNSGGIESLLFFPDAFGGPRDDAGPLLSPRGG